MESSDELRQRAERYRRIAHSITDGQAVEALNELAAEYDALAATLEAAGPPWDPNKGAERSQCSMA
jgi:hypothetical protein